MDSVLWSIVLWPAGTAGVVLAGLLVLCALAWIVVTRSTGWPAAGILLAGVVLAVAAGWAVTRAMQLDQARLLVQVHEPLLRLVAASVYARGAFDDLRAGAEPSAGIDALRTRFDSHERSLAKLLQAEWRYQRGVPWNERQLLHKMTWGVNDLLVHHASLAQQVPECPAVSAAASPWSEATTRLQQRVQTQRMLAGVLGEMFEGDDFDGQASDSPNEGAVLQAVAAGFGALALCAAVALALVRRRRAWHPIDGLVAGSAIVLAGLAGWVAFGAAAQQERLRANLHVQVSAVYRETRQLEDGAKALKATLRPRWTPPDTPSGSLVAEHGDYLNSLYGLARVVRVWDRAVLTGTLDAGLVSPERIRTHDDLLDGVRARTLALYRQYLQLDRRLTDLGCRSAWFARDPSQSREDRLVGLPAAQ